MQNYKNTNTLCIKLEKERLCRILSLSLSLCIYFSCTHTQDEKGKERDLITFNYAIFKFNIYAITSNRKLI